MCDLFKCYSANLRFHIIQLTKYLSDEAVLELVRNKAADKIIVEFPKFPCHTEATERCIRLVTEASASVFSEDQRDGFIRARIESRGLMKTYDTKSDFRMLKSYQEKPQM